jgi:hypothetical protein
MLDEVSKAKLNRLFSSATVQPPWILSHWEFASAICYRIDAEVSEGFFDFFSYLNGVAELWTNLPGKPA